jgi:outer membrane protein assembly factor BamE (lipoprotein component of BamABCDE complex)
MKTLTTISAAIFILAGCASAGNQALKAESSDSVSQKIVKGTHTKDDVKKSFGSPNETSFTDSGNEIWRYKYAYATAKAVNYVPIANLFARGADVDRKELVVFFDKNGVVSNYSMQETKEEVKRGIIAN